MKRLLLSLIATILIFSVIPIKVSADKSLTPEEILKKKYPKETVKISKSADLNFDKKMEHFILTESGNFYFINSKGYLLLVSTGLIGDADFGEERIDIFSASQKEKQVAISYEYYPSNTYMEVYRLKDGGLTKVLEIMGDVGISIDKNGKKIYMAWKKYRSEGGWDSAIAIYTWNSKTLKYKASGTVPK